jgi:hypothetical protein
VRHNFQSCDDRENEMLPSATGERVCNSAANGLFVLAGKLDETDRGRCHDHNFSPIFGEKLDIYLKNQCYDPKLAKSNCITYM